MVAASSSQKKQLHKAILAFEIVQAFVILLVAGFGWNVSQELMFAALSVNEHQDGAPGGDVSSFMEVSPPPPPPMEGIEEMEGDEGDGRRRMEEGSPPPPPPMEGIEEMEGAPVAPGDMVTHRGDDQGMARCQLHLNVNMRLGWGKNNSIVDAEVLKVKADSGIKGNVTVGSLTIGEEKNACPGEKSYKGNCTYLKKEVWQLIPESRWSRYYTSSMYLCTCFLMIAWLALKLISLDGDLLDAVVGRVFRCCCAEGALEGHTNEMNLRFSFLPGWLGWPLAQICVYLRFKIASNTIMWPLTTLGYNKTCPNHIFTQLPGLVFWYVLAGIASADLVYTMLLYVITAKKPRLKKNRCLRLPQVLSVLAALFGAVVVFMKSTWSLIFGFKFDLSMSFEISVKFGMFQSFFLLLTLLEMVGLGVKIVKGLRTMEKGAASVPDSMDKAMDTEIGKKIGGGLASLPDSIDKATGSEIGKKIGDEIGKAGDQL